jgi:hypothetical protein
MRDILRLIRRLALVGVVLSVLALPLSLIPLNSALSPDIGDNELGDAIGLGVGIALLVFGVAGLILGGGLAVLARRAAADPAEIRGPRRTVLAVGLTVAAALVLIAAAFGGALLFVGAGVAYATGFLVVAVASRSRTHTVIAGALALVLLGSGSFLVWAQASQGDGLGRRMERVALLPPDMSAAVAAASAAAPDGWAVATLTAKVTDFAPVAELGYLPAPMVGLPLRGIMVADCAGAERLHVTARSDEVVFELATIPCSPDPQLAAFDIPAFAVRTDPAASYILGIEVDPVHEGSPGGMHRAMTLVALEGTPDPDRAGILAAFAAGFGTEAPR